eukprot:1358305-Rhodomonas_salina.1
MPVSNRVLAVQGGPTWLLGTPAATKISTAHSVGTQISSTREQHSIQALSIPSRSVMVRPMTTCSATSPPNSERRSSLGATSSDTATEPDL